MSTRSSFKVTSGLDIASGNLKIKGSAGSAGQVLVSNGDNNSPTWSASGSIIGVAYESRNSLRTNEENTFIIVDGLGLFKYNVGSVEPDDDETSQTRMVRAISSMTDVDLISWKLADNTVKEVSKSELAEALKLAGLKQTEYWFI